jgi:hypothetical protein
MLQKLVVSTVLENYPQLTPNDVRSTSSGATGKDVLLSEAARNVFPFAVECKNHKSFAIYKHYEQARSNAVGSELPLLVIRQNRSEALVCLSLEDFMRILSGNQKSNKNKQR